ncbi:hypothetical protein JST97_05965 [bacterium]|nr:hypothetical protein [bacterium]
MAWDIGPALIKQLKFYGVECTQLERLLHSLRTGILLPTPGLRCLPRNQISAYESAYSDRLRIEALDGTEGDFFNVIRERLPSLEPAAMRGLLSKQRQAKASYRCDRGSG